MLLILLDVLINFVRNTESKFESANLIWVASQACWRPVKELNGFADFNYAADAQLTNI